jgi:hypothetical protein
MDRSYLSDKAVVEASRDFVCVRLITFENREEAKLMDRLMRGRGLVNTAFTILDPTGKRPLIAPARSPRWAYDDGADMAEGMRRIHERYPGNKKVDAEDLGMPLLEDVRIAINVTECDAQQLVIVRGDDNKTRRLMADLQQLCWSDEVIGRFLYVKADAATDWKAIAGSEKAPADGLLVVRTDTYGLTGKVVASAAAKSRKEQLRTLLLDAAAEFEPRSVDTRRLRREGKRKGLEWRSEVPVPGKR